MKPLSLHLESSLSNVPKVEMRCRFLYNSWEFQASIGCWNIAGTELNQGYGKWHFRNCELSKWQVSNCPHCSNQRLNFERVQWYFWKISIECMDGPYHMELDEAVKPVVHPPRKVTVALRDRLKEELDKLVREKVITPFTEPTNWVSCLVLVNKW